MEKMLLVEGMICANCERHVKNALEGIDGVEEAIIDLDKGTAIVVMTQEVPDEVLVAAVAEDGYESKVV